MNAAAPLYESSRGLSALTAGDRAICPRPLPSATQSVPRTCIVDVKLASALASSYRRLLLRRQPSAMRNQCRVGGLSGTTFPTGKSPLYGETFRAVLVACKQHGMGARVQGKRFSHQPLGFEPGAAHRALAAGRCCGGRHGADAQNGPAVSRARPQPRAQPVGGTAPAGRRKRAISNVPTVEQSLLSNF